ncbi:PH domain-containing protein [Salisediminibacterium halotolerans]|uniref:PH domain-containing protein n=1 Tax=Salisediminibacterium halotolerans TaxID=517425 RepID=UPI000F182143|nr:PH domain-containing protein [Salisediminibacterium halotolerans]RLJ77891.1 putative membrane protein [Actinophytocola xinjiangensis]RPE88771.1 putative membrane protein [Salisediminibacterium halotolerans]TWG36868.1 putative membrane protein [Salisediminibacterium halotolerans]GEL08400.1 membrane protein [Salisediminibacterium halotolerans]
MNEWKRQHPIAIFIHFLNSLRQLIVSFVIIFVFGTTADGMNIELVSAIIVIILLFTLLNGFINWWKFEYIVLPDELQVHQGLLFKKQRYIRKERVQSIDINAKLIQRLFGLVEVKIETAGGGNEPEFRIIALRRENAVTIKRELRRSETKSAQADTDKALLHWPPPMQQGKEQNSQQTSDAFQKHSADVDADVPDWARGGESESILSWDDMKEEQIEPEYEWKLTLKRLIIMALTSSGVGIAATFVAAIISQAPQVLPVFMLDWIVGWFIRSSIMVVASLLVTVLVIAWLFTLLTTSLKYGQFTLRKWTNEIHISRGILEKRQLTLKSNRITAVRVVQSPLRQLFNYVSVYVESAGGGTQEEEFSTILVPLCKRHEVNDILAATLPQYAYTPSYQRLPKESLRRYMIKLIVPALIVAGVLTWSFTYGWIAFLLPALAALTGYIQYKSAGIAVETHQLCLRSRVISKTEVMIPRRRMQTIESTQNLLQKLNDLYTLEVSVLSSIMGKQFHLRHISKMQRSAAFAWFSFENPDASHEVEKEE